MILSWLAVTLAPRSICCPSPACVVWLQHLRPRLLSDAFAVKSVHGKVTRYEVDAAMHGKGSNSQPSNSLIRPFLYTRTSLLANRNLWLVSSKKESSRESTSFWKLTAWKVSPSLRLLTHRGCSYLEEMIIYSFISRSKNPRSRPIIRCLIHSLFPAIPPAGFQRQAYSSFSRLLPIATTYDPPARFFSAFLLARIISPTLPPNDH